MNPRMVYIIMIDLEAGLTARPQVIEGRAQECFRVAVLSLIQGCLRAFESAAGPKLSRLDFESFTASVHRVERKEDHVDQILVRERDIMAKIEIPKGEGDWAHLPLEIVKN